MSPSRYGPPLLRGDILSVGPVDVAVVDCVVREPGTSLFIVLGGMNLPKNLKNPTFGLTTAIKNKWS